eukprot:5983677-Prymnesium_polylepis.1
MVISSLSSSDKPAKPGLNSSLVPLDAPSARSGSDCAGGNLFFPTTLPRLLRAITRYTNEHLWSCNRWGRRHAHLSG